MTGRIANPFAYGTLIDIGFDPGDPEVLLEVGMEHPVDWDALDDAGEVKCKRIDFVLTVAHVTAGNEPIGIHCTYDHIRKDHGEHDGLHVYVLALRPTRDKKGRESDRTALVTAHHEARHLRGRSWCADIGEIRIAWRHAPETLIVLQNGAFEPEPQVSLPPATDEEIERVNAGLDAWCASIESDAHAEAQTESALETSSPGIPLTDDDIEFVLDGPLAEMPSMKIVLGAAP